MDDVLVSLFSILASILPTVFYVKVLWGFYRFERDPIIIAILAFYWGAVPAILLTLLGDSLFGVSFKAYGIDASLVQASVQAPIIEEIAKGIPLMLVALLFLKEFDGLLAGITYGGLIGFGFAMTENINYFENADHSGGWHALGTLFFLRAGLFGLNHAVFSAVTGIGVGYACVSGPGSDLRHLLRKTVALLLALAGAITLHAWHNFFATLAATNPANILLSLISDYSAVVVLLGLILAGLRQRQIWIVEELAEEVETGILSPADYTAVTYFFSQLRSRLEFWRLLPWHSGMGELPDNKGKQLKKLTQLCSELASKKRQYRLYGEQRVEKAEIEDLRRRLAKLGDTSTPVGVPDAS